MKFEYQLKVKKSMLVETPNLAGFIKALIPSTSVVVMLQNIRHINAYINAARAPRVKIGWLKMERECIKSCSVSS